MNLRPTESINDPTGSGPSQDSRAACRNTDRTPRVGSKRSATTVLAKFNPDQTMAVLQLLTANKSGSQKYNERAYQHAVRVGVFHGSSSEGEGDDEVEEAEASSPRDA